MKSDRCGSSAASGSLVAIASSCLLAAAAASGAPAADGAHDDLLRFLNGDSLHGAFLGVEQGPVLRWRHADARDPIVLETDKLRHLSFNGGRARQPLRSPSFVLLHDGDRIPGTIVGLDRERLTIETEVAGTLTVPRQYVRQIAPNPHGGAVHYVGPFAPDAWTVIEPPAEEAEELAEVPGEDPDANPEADAAGEADEEAAEGPWVFSGGAYYSNSPLPIMIDAGTPDQARIRFTLAWRNRLHAAIAFHATIDPPAAKQAGEDEPKPQDAQEDAAQPPPPAVRRRAVLREAGSSPSFATTYGESYVLTIYSNYAQLYRCTYNEAGEPVMDRLSTANANLRLEEAGEAEFELRCDRDERTIILFADGRYVSQWEDPQGYAGTGTHLAFACQSSSSRLRVSDVVVSSWNGMLDSASSMEVDGRDIVLLTNGMDRFAGEVVALADGKFHLEGTYAGMEIPIGEIEEIRLAKSGETEDPEGSREAVRVLLQPFGKLTVTPLEATAERMKARHPALGDLDIDLRYAGLIEFSFTNSVLDSWDDDF